MSEINSLEVLVKTANVDKGGTDDNIWFDIGKYRWLLDNPKKDDFEKGMTNSFILPIQDGLKDTDIWRILICKAPDGKSGGWAIKQVILKLNGTEYYVSPAKEQWLKDEGREWEADDFKPLSPVPKSLTIPEETIEEKIDNYFSDLVNSPDFKKLKKSGTAKVNVECPNITLKQKFSLDITGVDPNLIVKATIVPNLSDGKVEFFISSFIVDVEYPLWVKILTLGVIEFVESYIEGKLKSELKRKLKEILQDEVNRLIPAGIIKHLSLRPKKIEVFFNYPQFSQRDVLEKSLIKGK